mgnify:CR=1 FL=1
MHSLLILVLILDALIAISSILNLVNMVRVNLLVEEKQAQALTVQLVRVCKTSAGKGGLLSSWFGVYACPGEIGTGEFTSTNPYGSPEAVPKATTVVPMKASGVLEHCDIGAHLEPCVWVPTNVFCRKAARHTRHMVPSISRNVTVTATSSTTASRMPTKQQA